MLFARDPYKLSARTYPMDYDREGTPITWSGEIRVISLLCHHSFSKGYIHVPCEFQDRKETLKYVQAQIMKAREWANAAKIRPDDNMCIVPEEAENV
jgi:hypothetical protein